MAEPWWTRAVIYQVYLRSFADGNQDGVGDLIGLRARLDYLSWLGVDTIWLSPMYRSPMVDFGFDITDHKCIDPIFGTPADFDKLVADVHRAGMRILVEFVPNHTSDQHPWFIDSRSSRDSINRDWYIWRDPAPGGGPPNNWLSKFGGSAWTLDQTTQQYFLHTFLPELPDLNWRNHLVEQAMFDVLRHWIARGVDGFRVDAVDQILKDPRLRDNPLAVGGCNVRLESDRYASQQHIHDRGHADIHATLRRLRRLLDHAPGDGLVALGEVFSRLRTHHLDHWANYYGAALDEIHLPLNLSLPTLPWSAHAFGETIDAVEAAIPHGAWPTVVLGSHDEGRVASRHGAAQARALSAVLFTLRGTPILYYGDELGLTDSVVDPASVHDPLGRHDPERNRDRGRSPMPWTTDIHAGFTTHRGGPWLPFSDGVDRAAVSEQRRDTRSHLALTRRLLCLRRNLAALQGGTYRRLDVGDADILAYERHHDQQTIVVVVNFTSAVRSVSMPSDDAMTLLLATEGTPQSCEDGVVDVGGHEAAILSTQRA